MRGKGAPGNVKYREWHVQAPRTAPMKTALTAKGFTTETMAKFAGIDPDYLKGEYANEYLISGMAKKGFSTKSMKKIVRSVPEAQTVTYKYGKQFQGPKQPKNPAHKEFKKQRREEQESELQMAQKIRKRDMAIRADKKAREKIYKKTGSWPNYDVGYDSKIENWRK